MDIFDANCRDKFHWTLKISFIAQRTRIFLLIKIKQLIMGGRRGGKDCALAEAATLLTEI